MPIKKRKKNEDLFNTPLRKTERWQKYYAELKVRRDEGDTAKKIPLSEEKYCQFIDKLVMNQIDTRNPMKQFDNFFSSFNKK